MRGSLNGDSYSAMANDGNLIDLRTRATEEQREIRSKGGKARAAQARERKTIASVLRMVLDEKTPEGMTKQEALISKCITKVYKNGDIRDLKVIAELLGEVKQVIDAQGITLNIIASEQGKDNIEKIMQGD